MIKRISKHSAVCFFILAAFGAGCASKDYKEKSSEKVAKTEYHDYGRSAVIMFSKGKADLTQSEKTKLENIVAAIGVDNIKRVEIASWSDKDFPKAGPDLPKVDKDLADERASKINDLLKGPLDVSMLRIRTYSMAETSNWIARMFRTDEAELKSVFAKEGETPMARDDFNVIMNEGGPSRAVVVFIRK